MHGYRDRCCYHAGRRYGQDALQLTHWIKSSAHRADHSSHSHSMVPGGLLVMS